MPTQAVCAPYNMPNIKVIQFQIENAQVIKMSEENPYTFQSDVYAFGECFSFVFVLVFVFFKCMYAFLRIVLKDSASNFRQKCFGSYRKIPPISSNVVRCFPILPFQSILKDAPSSFVAKRYKSICEMNEYIESIIFLQRLLSKRWPSKGSIRSISQESFSTNCWRGPCHIVTSVTKIRSQDTKNILWWFSSELFPYDKPCPLREMQQTISQILFMVGCGFLKADMMKLRTDTPKVPPTTISCESLRT